MQRPSNSRARAIEDGLAVAQTDAADGWIYTERALNFDETTGGWVLGRYDLSSSMGWSEANEATRQRILEAALQYLKSLPESHPDAAMSDQISGSGYRAAVLLGEAA